MKTLNFILTIVLIGMGFQTNTVLAQQDIQSFIDRYFEKREGFRSLSFEVDFKNKTYSQDDTSRTFAKVELVRDSLDKVFSGYVFIQTTSEIYAYDGERAFFGSIASSSLVINEIDNNPGINIKRDWASDLIETAFLTKNQSPRLAIQNPEIITTVTDTILGQRPCKGLLMQIPNQEEFTEITVFVAIDTIEYMLRQRVTSMMFQENEQYQSWTFTNPVYGNQKELTKLNDEFLSSFKHQEIYEYIEPDTTGETAAQIDYSTLQGRMMVSEELFDIKAIDAEVIVLDFWYSACYPCIKSIPEVNKVCALFDDRSVAVFGVNIIDDELKNKSRIEKYVRNNPMAYQTIMADGKSYFEWVPEGYPMLLILDKDYQLIHIHGGYSEGMAEEIAEIIEEHLSH